MNRKHTLAAILGCSLLVPLAGTPVLLAADNAEATLEQRTDEAEAAIHDAWLDGKLDSALLFNEYLDSFDIDTEVRGGVAYLNGAVESDIDRDLAGEVALSIKGISKVENKLVVDKSKATMAHTSEGSKDRDSFKQAVSNATLTARVKTELLLNSNTSGMAIDVDSKDGVVTLSGEVKSGEEKELAARIAENADGAKSVMNHLTVASKGKTG